MLDFIFHSKINRIAFSSTLAFFLYGTWAYYINFQAFNKLSSAFVQGISSFLSTAALAYVIEFVFNHTKKPWRFYLSAFGPYSIVTILTVIAHVLTETSEILQTISLNLVIGNSYFAFYVYKLEKNEKEL